MDRAFIAAKLLHTDTLSNVTMGQDMLCVIMVITADNTDTEFLEFAQIKGACKTAFS